MNKAVAFAPSLDPLLQSFLPQVATLEGTVLVTRTGWCDLATAASVRLGPFPAYRLTGGHPFVTLQARQELRSRPVRLLIQYPGGNWTLVTQEHLRLLAQIIGARRQTDGQADRKAAKAAKRLREIADVSESDRSPVDWSFRTDPQGSGETGPGNGISRP